MFLKVTKSQKLKGEITIPPSKAHSFRALLLACLANGISVIREPKISSDWNLALEAMQMYGVKIKEIEKNIFQIKGVAGKLCAPEDIINVGNSGSMLFFLIGIAASCNGWTVITGDHSIRKLRIVTRNLFKPFTELGITIISTKNDGMAPLIIKGKIKGKTARIDGSACQPVFSLLIAGALSPTPLEIFVTNPGETAYIELLLHWFKKVGIKFENAGNKYEHYIFPGNKAPSCFEQTIPPDWSAVGYPLLAAIIIKNSEIKIKGMDLQDPYGDKEVVYILQKMGANLTINNNCLTAKSSKLHAIEVDMNNLPDQLPTVAVAACFAKGKTVIKNALTARWKECDRISAITDELTKMGAKIQERKDGLIINQDGTWKLKGGIVNGHRDHRMVLSLAIAGLNSDKETIISNAEMINKSFENFVTDMRKIGTNLILKEKLP